MPAITSNRVIDYEREVDLRVIEHALEEIAAETKPLLRDVLRYALLGGKHLRARLLLAARDALVPSRLPVNSPSAIHAACATELLHTATLLQDDMIDRAEERRGRPAAHLVYGGALTTLASDWLCMRAFRLAYSVSPEWSDALIAAAQEMAETEASEESRYSRHTTVTDVLDVARGKTGSLFRATFQAVGMLAGLPHQEQLVLKEFGSELGITFQLIDDLNDVVSSSAVLGQAS